MHASGGLTKFLGMHVARYICCLAVRVLESSRDPACQLCTPTVQPSAGAVRRPAVLLSFPSSYSRHVLCLPGPGILSRSWLSFPLMALALSAAWQVLEVP